jgi:hypothetical protein
MRKSVVAEHAEVVVEGASCAHRPYLCDRYDRVVLPTCETRHDRPGCRAGRRSIDHLANYRGKDALAGAGQREGGGVGHDRACGRWDLRIDGADEDLIRGERRNLGGHQLEMMYSQLVDGVSASTIWWFSGAFIPIPPSFAPSWGNAAVFKVGGH